MCDLCGKRLPSLLLFLAAQIPKSWPRGFAGRRPNPSLSLGEAQSMLMEWRWQAVWTEVWPADPVDAPVVGRKRSGMESSGTLLLFCTTGVYPCCKLVATQLQNGNSTLWSSLDSPTRYPMLSYLFALFPLPVMLFYFSLSHLEKSNSSVRASSNDRYLFCFPQAEVNFASPCCLHTAWL
jgi:hypothetical protein